MHVQAPESAEHRTWADVRALLLDADLPTPVREGALAVFERLAIAEGRVHRVEPESVHFHEVGALDALADVVGVVAGFEHLGLDRLHASPVTLGSGSARGAHGVVPIPGPAVLELLQGVPVTAGPVAMEMCTPTGAALLAARVDEWGGAAADAGGAHRHGRGRPRPGRAAERRPPGAGRADRRAGPVGPVVLECNVDDLDPRLWPGVLDALFAAGASDAWLTPILMKKGRPAHTLSALCRPEVVADVQAAIFASTSTIGLRMVPVGKTALERTTSSVEVVGGRVGVKLAVHDGRVVNVSVEYEDVAALARTTGLPVKEVLRAATAAAEEAHPAG